MKVLVHVAECIELAVTWSEGFHGSGSVTWKHPKSREGDGKSGYSARKWSTGIPISSFRCIHDLSSLKPGTGAEVWTQIWVSGVADDWRFELESPHTVKKLRNTLVWPHTMIKRTLAGIGVDMVIQLDL
jgi:hypothetical protein